MPLLWVMSLLTRSSLIQGILWSLYSLVDDFAHRARVIADQSDCISERRKIPESLPYRENFGGID